MNKTSDIKQKLLEDFDRLRIPFYKDKHAHEIKMLLASAIDQTIQVVREEDIQQIQHWNRAYQVDILNQGTLFIYEQKRACGNLIELILRKLGNIKNE